MSVFALLARCRCMAISPVTAVVRNRATIPVTNADAVVVTNVPIPE